MTETKDKAVETSDAAADACFKMQEGIRNVTVTVFGKETISEDRIPIRPFVTDTAHVSVKAGATISLGPKTFEFARIDVFLSIPCYKEEVDDIFPRIKDWVDDRMRLEVDEIKGMIK